MLSFQWLFYFHRLPLVDLISPLTAQFPLLVGWFVPWSFIAKWGKNSFLNKIISFSIPGAEKNPIFQAVQIQSLIDFLIYFLGYFDHQEMENYKSNYKNHFHIIYLAYSLDPNLDINKMEDEEFQDFLDLLNDPKLLEDPAKKSKYEFFPYLNVYKTLNQQKNPFNKILEKVYGNTLKYFLKNKISDDRLLTFLQKEEITNFDKLHEIVQKNLGFFMQDKKFIEKYVKNSDNLEETLKDFSKSNFNSLKSTLSSKAIFDIDRSQRLKIFLCDGKIVYPEGGLDFLKVMFFRTLEIFFFPEISPGDKRKTEEAQDKIEFICTLHRIKHFLNKNPIKNVYKFIEIVNSKPFRTLLGLPTQEEKKFKKNIEKYKELKAKEDRAKGKLKKGEELVNVEKLTKEENQLIRYSEEYEKRKKDIKDNQKFLKDYEREILIGENILYNNQNELVKNFAKQYKEIKEKQKNLINQEDNKKYEDLFIKIFVKDNFTAKEKKEYEALQEISRNPLSDEEKLILKNIENIQYFENNIVKKYNEITRKKINPLSEQEEKEYEFLIKEDNHEANERYNILHQKKIKPLDEKEKEELLKIKDIIDKEFSRIKKQEKNPFNEEEEKEYNDLLAKKNKTSEEKTKYNVLHQKKINPLSKKEIEMLQNIENRNSMEKNIKELEKSIGELEDNKDAIKKKNDLRQKQINLFNKEKEILKNIKSIKSDFSKTFKNIKSLKIGDNEHYYLSKTEITENKKNLQAYEEAMRSFFLQFENCILKDDFSKKYKEEVEQVSFGTKDKKIAEETNNKEGLNNLFKKNNYSRESVEQLKQRVINYLENSLDIKYRIKRYKAYKSFKEENKTKEFDEFFKASNSNLDGFSEKLVEINQEKEDEEKKIENFKIKIEEDEEKRIENFNVKLKEEKKYKKLKNFYEKYHGEINKYFNNSNLDELTEHADRIAKICQVSRDGFLNTQNDLKYKLEDLTEKSKKKKYRKYKQISQYLKQQKSYEFLNKFQSPDADMKKKENEYAIKDKCTNKNDLKYKNEMEENDKTYKKARAQEIESKVSVEYAKFFNDDITYAIDIQINKYLIQNSLASFKSVTTNQLSQNMSMKFAQDIMEILADKVSPFFDRVNEKKEEVSSVDYIGSKNFLKSAKENAVRYYFTSQNKEKKKMNHTLIIGSEYDLDAFLFILQQVLEDSTVNKINFRESEFFLAKMASQSGTKKVERKLSSSMSRDYELFGFLAVQTRLLLKTFSDMLVTVGHSSPFTDFSVYNFSGIKRRKTDILSFNQVGKWLDLIKPFFYYKKVNGTILIGLCKNSNIDKAIESRFASAITAKALDFKHCLFLTRRVILSCQREFGSPLFDDNIPFEEICFRVARVLRNRTNDVNEMQEIIQYIFHVRAKIKSMTLDMFERVMSQ